MVLSSQIRGFTLALGRKSSIETSVSHLGQENTVLAAAIIISVSSVVGEGKIKRCGIFLPIQKQKLSMI